MHRFNRLPLMCAALASLALPMAAEAKNVLIVDTNNPVNGNPVVTDRSLVLGGLQVAAGNTVTYSGLLLPGFSDYDQIWDLIPTAISSSMQADYLVFLQGGGALALIGENNTVAKLRNGSIEDLLESAGSGDVETGSSFEIHDVLAPFDGPAPVTQINFHSPGGFSKIGSGKPITKGITGGSYGGVAFEPGTLANAGFGRLVVFMDTGLFTPEDAPFFGSIGAQSLTRNLIHYLGDEPTAPTPTPGTRGVPEPATWALMLVGFGAAGMGLRRRRAIAAIG